ncbi:hypothetical protein CTI14_42490 [Methylobacterium radiotolerans]|nr:hypothetical protein CTI14_42490 [Methylobacterium radiotolerans]
MNYLAFLRAKVPGFEQAYVLDIAPQLGIRETRRIVGEAVLSQEDVPRPAVNSPFRARAPSCARKSTTTNGA